MPDIAGVLKEEIQRLARKEAKAATTNLRRDNVTLKRTVAEHKRRLAALERDNRRLLSRINKRQQKSLRTGGEEVEKARITAKMIRSIRERFGLSQSDLAGLLAVSANTVCQWEHREGSLTFRGGTKAAIITLRRERVRDLRMRLEMHGSAALKVESLPVTNENLTVGDARAVPFWESASLDELAEQQGVSPVDDLDEIAALWPADDDPDRFLSHLLAERGEQRRLTQSEENV